MRSAGKPALRRNAQLVRILRILRDLERLGGVELEELAERYGATTRTIRRDFEALAEAGLPVEALPGEPRQRWQLVRTAGLGRLVQVLDAGHLLALKMLEAQGSVARGVPALLATLEDLAGKIERAVGPKGRQQLLDIEACFYAYDKHLYASAPADVLWPLVEAIAARRLCEITYRSPRRRGAATTFDILPLRLFIFQQAPYVMCHIRKYDAVGSLHLHRLDTLRVREEVGEVPGGFDPELLEHAAFGVWADAPPTAYTLRFDAEVAPYIAERRWHPTQAIERHADGGLTLSFTCHSATEVEAWVASWRHHVRVLAPEGLRDRLRTYGAQLADWYADEAART
jgi:predicted DNA-binding transcriptional regulator YafY